MNVDPDRFGEKAMIQADGCIVWSGVTDDEGYGRFRLFRTKRRVMAHRFSYELLVGQIPDGMELDHGKRRCRACSRMNQSRYRAVPHHSVKVGA